LLVAHQLRVKSGGNRLQDLPQVPGEVRPGRERRRIACLWIAVQEGVVVIVIEHREPQQVELSGQAALGRCPV